MCVCMCRTTTSSWLRSFCDNAMALSCQISRVREDAYDGGSAPQRGLRCVPTISVLTMPIAAISASIVVGPTNLKPRLLRSAARATDSGSCVGTSL